MKRSNENTHTHTQVPSRFSPYNRGNPWVNLGEVWGVRSQSLNPSAALLRADTEVFGASLRSASRDLAKKESIDVVVHGQVCCLFFFFFVVVFFFSIPKK